MFRAYINGLFPRSEDLIDVWKGLDRGLVSRDKFRDRLIDECRRVIDIQRRGRLTYIHEPQIDWDDIFRPFTGLDGVEAGPLTRFFETNTFYRRPIFKSIVEYREDYIGRFLHRELLEDYGRAVTLPGPYTFIKLSESDDEELSRASIKNIYGGLCSDLKVYGYDLVILHEPALAYFYDVDWDLSFELYKPIMGSGIEYIVHPYFGDVSDKVDELRALSPWGFSIDLAYTNIDEFTPPSNTRIVLGIIDATTTLMEDIEHLAGRVIGFRDRVGIKDIDLTNNTHLEYLPFKIGVAKVELLSRLMGVLGSG